MSKLLQGEELEKRAIELGVDIQGPLRTQSVSGRSPRTDDNELQKRVLEAERSIREHRLWLKAVISAQSFDFLVFLDYNQLTSHHEFLSLSGTGFNEGGDNLLEMVNACLKYG